MILRFLCGFVAVFLLTCDVSFAQAQSIQTIAEGVIWRESANNDDRPPWKRITVANIFGFKRKPRVGAAVTVITLRSEFAPLDLRILKAEQKEDPCNASLPRLWEVELEPVTQREFFDVLPPTDRNDVYPFDVVIIYPAVKSARQIDRNQLKRATLPKRALINTVKAAIDLNVDRKPDVIVTAYCCLAPTKPVNECDYTCGKTFKRVGNSWKLVETSGPC